MHQNTENVSEVLYFDVGCVRKEAILVATVEVSHHIVLEERRVWFSERVFGIPDAIFCTTLLKLVVIPR